MHVPASNCPDQLLAMTISVRSSQGNTRAACVMLAPADRERAPVGRPLARHSLALTTATGEVRLWHGIVSHAGVVLVRALADTSTRSAGGQAQDEGHELDFWTKRPPVQIPPPLPQRSDRRCRARSGTPATRAAATRPSASESSAGAERAGECHRPRELHGDRGLAALGQLPAEAHSASTSAREKSRTDSGPAGGCAVPADRSRRGRACREAGQPAGSWKCQMTRCGRPPAARCADGR
jgi:hypothetical protein